MSRINLKGTVEALGKLTITQKALPSSFKSNHITILEGRDTEVKLIEIWVNGKKKFLPFKFRLAKLEGLPSITLAKGESVMFVFENSAPRNAHIHIQIEGDLIT